MSKHKRHLTVRHKRLKSAACGTPEPRHLTPDVSRVTCDRCARTLAMADREVESHTKSKSRGKARR